MPWTRHLVALPILLVLTACGGSASDPQPVVPTAPPEEEATALIFDGIDDVALAPAPGGQHDFSAGLTLEGWIRPAALPPMGVTHSFLGELGVIDLALHGDDGTLIGTIVTNTKVSVTTLPGVIQPDMWHHVALSYDGTTLRLFVDGVEMGFDTHVGVATPMTTLHWGNFGQFQGYIGDIDGVRLWGVPRSEPELAASMHLKVLPTLPGLYAAYYCDGNGQTLTDSSQNGAHGQLGLEPGVDIADPTRLTGGF